MKAFDIQAVTKIYPGQPTAANKNITLQIEEGEIFGLLGENGAGKSTLVKQMVNLLKVDSGQITLFGRPVGANPLYTPMNVAYMPQSGIALINLRVKEALYLAAHLRGLSRKEAQKERDYLIDLWQLGDFSAKLVSQISGGQKRLVQLATAMAGSLPVLVLDEPTNDLDPQRRKQVWDNLRRLNRQKGTTIIFITHDAIEAEKIIQRVGIMQRGEMVALGRPSDLKAQVYQTLRLELFFQPDNPPALPVYLNHHEIDAGRWLVYLEWDKVEPVLAALDLRHIDDFRLYSATLEDLYLHYAKQS